MPQINNRGHSIETKQRLAVRIREPDFRAYIAWEADQDGGVISVEYDPATDVEVRFSEANCRSIVARALGLGEGSFRVLGTHPWIVGSWVAERFRVGRIFLAGDSAHVTPPAGGFGASLGVHDAHNLCTKLGQKRLKSCSIATSPNGFRSLT